MTSLPPMPRSMQLGAEQESRQSAPEPSPALPEGGQQEAEQDTSLLPVAVDELQQFGKESHESLDNKMDSPSSDEHVITRAAEVSCAPSDHLELSHQSPAETTFPNQASTAQGHGPASTSCVSTAPISGTCSPTNERSQEPMEDSSAELGECVARQIPQSNSESPPVFPVNAADLKDAAGGQSALLDGLDGISLTPKPPQYAIPTDGGSAYSIPAGGSAYSIPMASQFVSTGDGTCQPVDTQLSQENAAESLSHPASQSAESKQSQPSEEDAVMQVPDGGSTCHPVIAQVAQEHAAESLSHPASQSVEPTQCQTSEEDAVIQVFDGGSTCHPVVAQLAQEDAAASLSHPASQSLEPKQCQSSEEHAVMQVLDGGSTCHPVVAQSAQEGAAESLSHPTSQSAESKKFQPSEEHAVTQVLDGGSTCHPVVAQSAQEPMTFLDDLLLEIAPEGDRATSSAEEQQQSEAIGNSLLAENAFDKGPRPSRLAGHPEGDSEDLFRARLHSTESADSGMVGVHNESCTGQSQGNPHMACTSVSMSSVIESKTDRTKSLTSTPSTQADDVEPLQQDGRPDAGGPACEDGAEMAAPQRPCCSHSSSTGLSEPSAAGSESHSERDAPQVVACHNKSASDVAEIGAVLVDVDIDDDVGMASEGGSTTATRTGGVGNCSLAGEWLITTSTSKFFQYEIFHESGSNEFTGYQMVTESGSLKRLQIRGGTLSEDGHVEWRLHGIHCGAQISRGGQRLQDGRYSDISCPDVPPRVLGTFVGEMVRPSLGANDDVSVPAPNLKQRHKFRGCCRRRRGL